MCPDAVRLHRRGMTHTTDRPTASPRPAGLKTALVRSLLLCLSGTAALAIYAVLTPSFNETAVRVLASTLLVGLFCMLCLACLTVLDSAYRMVGAGGTAAATGALASGLWLTWGTPDWDSWEIPGLVRTFLFCCVLAFACAHAALLLRVCGHVLGGLRAAVLACLALVATMMCAAIFNTDMTESDGYWRLLGVLGILDVLGTVCLPVLARLGRKASAEE